MKCYSTTDDALNVALIAAQIADEEKEGKKNSDMIRELKGAAEHAESYQSCPAQESRVLQGIVKKINNMPDNTKPMDALKVVLELVKAYSEVGISLCKKASSPTTSFCAEQKHPRINVPRID